MMTADRFGVLKLLAKRPATVIDLVDDHNISVVQALVKMGYARDYSNHAGHRIPVRLRIWGITDAGRAALEQQSMTERNHVGQLNLIMPTSVERKEIQNE